MDKPTRAEDELDSNVKDEGPDDVNSNRGGLGERDAIGPQADVLSSTGTRIDTDATPEQMDIMRRGDAT